MGRAKQPTVAESCGIIHKWLDRHAASVRAKLNPPADEAALLGLQKAVGIDLPEDFLISLRTHDGAHPVSGPIAGVPLLSAAGIAKEWKTLKPKRGQTLPPPPKPVSVPPGAIREVGWAAGWVPFAGPDEQNYLALDFEPGPAGVPGQVINFGADEFIYGSKRYVLAGSFREFMAFLAGLFAAGGVEVDEEDGEPSDFLRLTRRRSNGSDCNLLQGLYLLFENGT